MQRYTYLVPVRAEEGFIATSAPQILNCYLDVEEAQQELPKGYKLRRAIILIDDEEFVQ